MKKKDKENIMNVMTKYLTKHNKENEIKNIVSDNEAGFTSAKRIEGNISNK